MLFETINIISVVLFVIGILLLLIELFMPGFGIFGGLGLISLVICIIVQAKNITEALILLLAIGGIVTVLALVVARSFRRGFLYRSSIVLKNAADKDEGYIANEDKSRFAGKTGISLTPLRPSGTASFESEKTDVVTDGEFIPSGARIEVVRIVGARIIVRQPEE
ncbi:MAG: NfeD family protein [Christensenellales bacterium]